VSHSTRLARFSASIDIDQDIERIQMIGQYQRLAHDHATVSREKNSSTGLSLTTIFAFTGLNEDSSLPRFCDGPFHSCIGLP